MGKPFLVLASNSPRRRELLALSGWDFDTLPAEVDENQRPGETPGSYVLRLAESKARACNTSAPANRIILSADTAVVDGKTILGKPEDAAEAKDMLRRLRGHTHQVFTGIAAMRPEDGNLVTDLCVSDVPMRKYADAEIDSYVASGDPLDKAGAYAIQHPGFQPVERMSGCYACVMGLPLCHLVRMLRRFDILPPVDISSACQSNLNYACRVSATILNGGQAG
jgi:septum formation protein